MPSCTAAGHARARAAIDVSVCLAHGRLALIGGSSTHIGHAHKRVMLYIEVATVQRAMLAQSAAPIQWELGTDAPVLLVRICF